ncbi:MAG: ATP-binding protein, partial [Solirubrobacteraceae bacterium]
LALLERALEDARLITITGPGGCGKTRVALEFAARMAAGTHSSTVAIVELATATTMDELVSSMMRALGLRERGGRAAVDVLLDELAERDVLLVLDNSEQIARMMAELAARLLRAAPAARLLVTSREPLGAEQEAVFLLAPLGLPEPGGGVAAIVGSDAGRLFVDRASGSDPAFALTPANAPAVARICRALDGLPLALELAAARVPEATLDEIATALATDDDRIAALPQHRSLTASLDWSLRLLDRDERRLFASLAVFAGGWGVAAARAVGLPDAGRGRVVQLLGALEAKGLIVPTPTADGKRWSLLRTIGEHAERVLALDRREHDGAQARHLAWYLNYARGVDSLLLAPRGIDLIDEEAPNLRLALRRAISAGAPTALQMAASLTRYWLLAERYAEARSSCASVLADVAPDGDGALRAIVHCGAALSATLAEDYENAFGELQAGLSLSGAIAGHVAEADFRQMSSMVLILTGVDAPAGLRSARLALEQASGSTDRLGLAWALVTVAFAEGLCDRFDAALVAYQDFLSVPGAPELVRLRTWAELAAAYAEVMIGSPARALAHAESAVELEGEWPSMTHFIAVSQRIHALARLGRADDALAAAASAITLARDSGAMMALPAIEVSLAIAELVAGEAESAGVRARRVAELPQLHTVALMREVLGYVALAAADGAQASGEADALREIGRITGSRRQRAVADLIGGRAAISADPDRARKLLHASLSAHAALALERGVADALE